MYDIDHTEFVARSRKLARPIAHSATAVRQSYCVFTAYPTHLQSQ